LILTGSIGSKYPAGLEIDRLERELKAAREEIASLRQALTDNINESADFHRGLNEFRDSVRPIFDGLCRVFGQLDRIPAVGVVEQASPKANAAWESWKQKLGGQAAKAIDALLLHGALTQVQLRIHVGCANGSTPGIVSQLWKAGLINKNGGKISLKEL
jgi:hypothetical protein